MKNLEHHAEQMEAARHEFLALWRDSLLESALVLGITEDCDIALVQHIAWNAFRAGIERRP